MAALSLTGATAEAQDIPSAFERTFCRDLRRAIRVAPDFRHLEIARAAPPTFGFRNGCRAWAGSASLPAAWSCHQNLAPHYLSLDSLAKRTAECLPEARREAGRYGRETVFVLPGARVRIQENGGPRAHVGRIVTFRIEAAAPPPR
jgi:hypothetical protein